MKGKVYLVSKEDFNNLPSDAIFLEEQPYGVTPYKKIFSELNPPLKEIPDNGRTEGWFQNIGTKEGTSGVYRTGNKIRLPKDVIKIINQVSACEVWTEGKTWQEITVEVLSTVKG